MNRLTVFLLMTLVAIILTGCAVKETQDTILIAQSQGETIRTELEPEETGMNSTGPDQGITVPYPEPELKQTS